MNPVLYNKYKVKLSEQLKNDILDAAIVVYGEKHKEQFEQNMKSVQIHTKISSDTLKNIVKQKLSKELIRLIEQYKDAYDIENDNIGDLSNIDYRLLSKTDESMMSSLEELFGDTNNLVIRNGSKLEFNLTFAQTDDQRKMLQRITGRI